jgi:hypothetical protein
LQDLIIFLLSPLLQSCKNSSLGSSPADTNAILHDPTLHTHTEAVYSISTIEYISDYLDLMVYMVQLTGETVGEVKAVADMHQRKAEMARNSDAFIALPGWYKSAKYKSKNYWSNQRVIS